MFRLQRPHQTREHPVTTAIADRPTATREQTQDLRRLLDRVEALGKDMSGTRRALNLAREQGSYTATLADDMAQILRDEIAKIERKPAGVPTGRYAVTTDAGHYAFYRVWKGDRATLVFLQVSDDEQRLGRPAAAAILAKITAGGVLEASKAYGREIGVCGVCNRTLTNPDSVAAGIGPICAARL
jgi:hypothetical protein